MQDQDPYTIYMHLGAEPGTLNPILATDAYASTIDNRIYESLIKRDLDSLEFEPELAESWRVSSDRLRFTFHLKKGVTWSDGVAFTADDVLYSYNRIKDPKVACAHLKVYYVDVLRVRKINDYAIEFIYRKPYFRALEICGGLPIVPRHIFDDGTDFNTHKQNRSPIGTGPYIFKKWETGRSIVLERNEHYRGKKPAIKKIVYKLVTESSVALQMLKKGRLDVLSLRSIQWVRQTASNKFQQHFYKLRYFLPNYAYIGWNAARPQFKDARVRRALTQLVNRNDIVNKLNFGLGVITTGNFYIYSKDYNNTIKPYPFDVARAKQLLQEAGWKDSNDDGILDKNNVPFSFVFTIPSGSKFAERLSTILKEDFKKVGIEVSIQRYEWAVFLEKLNQRDFDAVTLRWSMPFESDPYQVWHSSQIKNGSNFVGFNNPEADNIIIASRQEFNKQKRMKLFHRFHEIIHEEQPYTFLFCAPELVAVSKRFSNVKVHKSGLDLLEWKVNADYE